MQLQELGNNITLTKMILHKYSKIFTQKAWTTIKNYFIREKIWIPKNENIFFFQIGVMCY